MYFELKENRPHGTPENPFSQYHISDVKRAFQIPVHWHDELEIIYVKHGKLHVTISGENYIGNPKEAFVVSPGSLHFMDHRQVMWIITHFCFLWNIYHFRQMILWKKRYFLRSSMAGL